MNSIIDYLMSNPEVYPFFYTWQMLLCGIGFVGGLTVVGAGIALTISKVCSEKNRE